jgi:hypothetical protein
MRGMMLATLAIGVACAIATPLLKALKIDEDSLLTIVSGALLGATVTVIFRCIRRYKLEHICGPQLAVIGMQSKASRRGAIGSGFVTGFQQLGFAVFISSHSPQTWLLPLFSFIGGCGLAGAFLALWWKDITTSCELSEHGVLIGSWRFYEWQAFRGYRRAFDNSLQLLTKYNYFTLRVSAELEPRVIEILETHIPKPQPVAPTLVN